MEPFVFRTLIWRCAARRVTIDDISDLNYRVTLSPLAGYYIIKKPNTSLSVEAVLSLITEKQGGVDKTYMAARVAERYEYKFGWTRKSGNRSNGCPRSTISTTGSLISKRGVSAPISKGFEVRLLLQDNYDNQPAAGRLKNDMKLVAGVGYKF